MCLVQSVKPGEQGLVPGAWWPGSLVPWVPRWDASRAPAFPQRSRAREGQQWVEPLAVMCYWFWKLQMPSGTTWGSESLCQPSHLALLCPGSSCAPSPWRSHWVLSFSCPSPSSATRCCCPSLGTTTSSGSMAPSSMVRGSWLVAVAPAGEQGLHRHCLPTAGSAPCELCPMLPTLQLLLFP